MTRTTVLLLLLFPAANCGSSHQGASQNLPHIVLILADDMGYGDPGCYNPDSKTPTPNLDRLAAEGIRFTDAHSPGAVCVPSRYGLLTGQYPFRASLEWRERAVIEPGRLTLPLLLKDSGYSTAMVGKWHLGFDGGPDYDYTSPLEGGPLDRGFDSFFGIPHSLDIPPYYFIRDRQVEQAPTASIEANSSPGWSPIQGAFWRAGPMAPDFQHHEVLPRFAEEAVRVIDRHGRTRAETPLFLYLALTAPHTPWLPTEAFRNRGDAGAYGEFVAQVDHVLGQVLQALDGASMSENTLVIFTSDNGPVWYAADVERLGHDSAGGYRGMKADAWEAGHRVPFVARWPDRIEKGRVSSYLICLTDLLATFAALVDSTLPAEAGTDGLNILPALLGENGEPRREAIVLKADASVIRQGNWKLITHLGSGGFSEPGRVPASEGGPQGQLYDLSLDPLETRNLWNDRPDVVGKLTALLSTVRQ